MTESEFRLTPIDVRSQEFRRTALGYNAVEVEDFKERVAEEMERLIKDRLVLEERLQNAREQLKSLREREKAINDAVMMAQELRAGTQEAAQHEADLIIQEARIRADRIVDEAREAEDNVIRGTEEVQRQFRAYLAAFRRLLDRHLSELDVLAQHEQDGSPPEAQP
ncbi:MAG: DivIVA domain-containing protein [Gemmatimonadales bacterium]